MAKEKPVANPSRLATNRAWPANRLPFGDNLKRLPTAKVFPEAPVDLVYLVPPVDSDRNYGVLLGQADIEPTETSL